MAKIVVSFKDKEEYLYKHVKEQMSESVYIKQLIKKDIEASGQREQPNQQKQINNFLDF